MLRRSGAKLWGRLVTICVPKQNANRLRLISASLAKTIHETLQAKEYEAAKWAKIISIAPAPTEKSD
jgi:hypothetical protein